MSELARRNTARRPIVVMVDNDLPGAAPAKPPQRLDPQLQFLIGERLRAYYSDLLGEPVPDRFMDLLRGFDTPSVKGDRS